MSNVKMLSSPSSWTENRKMTLNLWTGLTVGTWDVYRFTDFSASAPLAAFWELKCSKSLHCERLEMAISSVGVCFRKY